MHWDAATVRRQLVRYRDTGEMHPDLTRVLQTWIEVQVSRHGKDLDRGEAIQELWVFLLERQLPKIRVRKVTRRRSRVRWKCINVGAYLQYCIWQEIIKIRRRKLRDRRYVPLREESRHVET